MAIANCRLIRAASYFAGDRFLASYTYGPLGPISRTAEYDDADLTNNRDHYYLRDASGGHMGVLFDHDSDSDTPAEPAFAVYDAFGNNMTKPLSGTGSFAWRGGEGSVTDREPNLVHMQARHYDPTLGRFIQADTLMLASFTTQGMNRYIYTENDPVNRSDPQGEGIGSLLKSLMKWGQFLTIPLKILYLIQDYIALARCEFELPDSFGDILMMFEMELALITLFAFFGAALSVLLLPVASSFFGFFLALGLLAFIVYGFVHLFRSAYDFLVSCSPKLDPVVVRVSTAREPGKEAQDEREATHPGADHRQAA